MENIKNIFWDFDGVLMNSNHIRNQGFLEVLKGFPTEQVRKLLDFHKRNGGLSRYVKFRYFFEEIRQEPISDEEIKSWALKFSEIMLNSLINQDLLIKESIHFVKDNYAKYNMHIVSGSDGSELRKICKGVEIAKYFNSIDGSPTPKINLVANILKKRKYSSNHCILIGDSINDLEAANFNDLTFWGYNNIELKEKQNNYIINFKNFMP